MSGFTFIWFTPGSSYSIGSSIVMMRWSIELIVLRNAYNDVDLPDPVGPVTRMIPCGRSTSLRTIFSSSGFSPRLSSPR